MKVAGIIAEYNPFHNGHRYHIDQTKRQTGSDYAICVMSGNFTQRGQPALADKWARTRMALAGGVDAVFELPFLYATQSAEGFASGGVKMLDALGVDVLSFGSESGDLCELEQCANAFLQYKDALNASLKNFLSKGISYAAAQEQAARSLGLPYSAPAGPNNILAIEYIKAVRRHGSAMGLFALKREGSGYSDEALGQGFPSARALRLAFEKGQDISSFLPSESLPYLPKDRASNIFFFCILLYKLRMMTAKQIASVCDVSEGLEYKIKEAAKSAQDYEALIHLIKSKRYSYTRIARVLLYCLLDVTKGLILRANSCVLPGIRLLGFRRKSEALLSYLSTRSAVPIVTKAAELPDHFLFTHDRLATDVYSLLYKKAAPAGRDYTEKLIVL